MSALSLRLQEDWDETSQLIGRVVMTWGEVMGLIYGLPADMDFPSPEAIQLCLAEANGDSSRISQMVRLLKRRPRLMPPNEAREKAAISILDRICQLSKTRDRIIHSIPVLSLNRDPQSRAVIRQGCYLVQTRKWADSERYLKAPEVVRKFIEELNTAKEDLRRVAKPLLYEDWEMLFHDLDEREHQ